MTTITPEDSWSVARTVRVSNCTAKTGMVAVLFLFLVIVSGKIRVEDYGRTGLAPADARAHNSSHHFVPPGDIRQKIDERRESYT